MPCLRRLMRTNIICTVICVMFVNVCYCGYKIGLENGEQLPCASSSEKPGDWKICKSCYTFENIFVVLQ